MSSCFSYSSDEEADEPPKKKRRIQPPSDVNPESQTGVLYVWLLVLLHKVLILLLQQTSWIFDVHVSYDRYTNGVLIDFQYSKSLFKIKNKKIRQYKNIIYFSSKSVKFIFNFFSSAPIWLIQRQELGGLVEFSYMKPQGFEFSVPVTYFSRSQWNECSNI